MKRVFTTMMPDRAGAFIGADRCITELGLNITRVSYFSRRKVDSFGGRWYG